MYEGSPLFNITPDNEFFGRTNQIRHILGRIIEPGGQCKRLLLSGRRWTGKTEVLRRVHRELFWKQARFVPVYFQFRARSAEGFCEDFLRELVKQYLAFTERDVEAARAEHSLESLERRLLDRGMTRASGLLSRHREAVRSGDRLAALRGVLSSPRLIEEADRPVLLILDDLDRALDIKFRGLTIAEGVLEELRRSPYPFLASVTSGEFLLDSAEVLRLEGLSEEESVSMMSVLSRGMSVGFDTEVLLAAARRLGGNPLYMRSLVLGARKSRSLSSLKDLARVYAEEVTAGAISAALRTALGIKGKADLRVLHALMERGSLDEEGLNGFGLERGEFDPILSRLSGAGLVVREPGLARWAGDSVEGDFISYTYEVAVRGSTPDEARCWLTAALLKEGFGLMGEKLGGRFREEVKEAVRSFDGQRVRKVLLNHRAFTQPESAGSKDEEVTLPFFTGSFDAGRLERGEGGPRIIIAHGFQRGRFDPGSEVIWIVGVKDTLSPVNRGDAENFIRRAALLKASFRKLSVRWLIGREGFTGEALKRLEEEGVYSTDARGLGIIRECTGKAQTECPPSLPEKEFEVVLPVSRNAELVAARVGDEVSAEAGFDEDSRDKIKAALVEACINAFEHGGAASGKTHLRFVISGDRLTIYVSNTGMGFDAASRKSPSSRGLPQRRGWGIELMKGLMDEVRFEEVEGGARVVLVKYIAPRGETKDAHGPHKP